MLFSWLKSRRRRRLLAGPFPADWSTLLQQVAHYRLLSPAEQVRLRDFVRIFIAERTFEGCKGLEINDEIRVTIAALAGVLLLGANNNYFDHVPTILVYPGPYVAPDQQVIGGVVMETESERLGEAHYRGPLVFSWPDVRRDAGRTGEGTNLVFHEFAHQLDMLNGAADGVPLLAGKLRSRWQRVMAGEYRRLCRSAAHGRPTVLDPYGATNPAEFFAVVTECFFDAPGELQREHPELYEVFRGYFKQDPAERF